MFTDLKSYASTRDTALAWAKVVPSHWKIQRAKTIMYAVDIRSSTGEEELLTVSSGRGVVPRSSANVTMFQAASYVGHKLCWPDDLVINSLWAWGRGLGVATNHGIVSTAYGVYRQRQRALEPAYLHQLVRSQPFQWELQVRSQGVWKSRLQMTDERWLDAPLLIPPETEQAAIVKYLAHANARINKAIAAKRRLIALLEEQKAATSANQLEGLTGSVGRLKHFSKIQTGLTLGKDYRDQDQTDYPYLRVANVQMGYVDIREVATLMIPESEAEQVTLREGDVLMTEGGDIDKLGRGTVWDGSISPCLHQNHVFAVRCFPDLKPEFLALWLSGPTARDYFYLTAKKTTNLASTNSTTVRELPIVVPSVRDQARLLDELTTTQAPMTDAIRRAHDEIALLQEFRTRLVADVVTGQVDVRGVAATLPDAAEAIADAVEEDVPVLDEELVDAVEGDDV